MLKAQPVIGVWNPGDSGLPTVASAPVAMNSWAPGVTQLRMDASDTAASYKFAVADQYGAGRPDFTYQARMLYADSVTPQIVNSAGGQITISGEGFRQGNRVSINGVPATVLSWSATQIVARTPSLSATGAALGDSLDVSVTDAATGGETTISSALSYANLADVVTLVSAPGALETGVAAGQPLAVRVFGGDGVTPVAGTSVLFSGSAGSAGSVGSAVFGACARASSCTLQTDATGLAETTVIGGAAGTVTLTATEMSGGGQQQVTITDADPVRSVAIANASGYVAAMASGRSPSWRISLTATQDAVAAVGVPVTWTAGQGLTLDKSVESTDTSGLSTVTVSAAQLSGGAVSVTGCAWTGTCASWTVYAVPTEQWRVAVASGAGQSVAVGRALAPVAIQVTDTAGHPLQGAPVTVYQTADAWEGQCVGQGRCPASPVLASSQSSIIADATGRVSVTPLQVPGLAQTVNIAAVTGTQGFVSLALVLTP